jgi:predicted nucleic acid-binding protein
VTVVLDTNVLVAAFATRGLCQSVFELCLDRHTIAISDPLIQELTPAAPAS